MNSEKAVDRINQNGILLVFPINNRKEPSSLWTQTYPRSQMSWNWDGDADPRVGQLWSLMKKLSDSRDVVYSKWYQSRATFFSRQLFRSLLRLHLEKIEANKDLSRTSLELLEILESDSPLSTKQLKKMADLQGKDNEKFYNRGLKALFKNFYIVAFGEVDDGAFPSLAIGSTRNLYEDLWNEARAMKFDEAQATVDRYMPTGSLVRKYLEKN